MKWKVFLAYSLTIILWGSAFPGIKVGLQSYSPEHLAVLRLLVGAIGLIIFAIIKRIKLPHIKDIPIILLLGFLGFTVYHTALSFGEKNVSAGSASLLVSTTPIFSAILASVFLKESFSKIGWLGSIVAFLGVAMISFGMGGSVSVIALGALFILLAALGESFYFVFQTNYLKKYGFLPFTVYTIISGAIFSLFFLNGIEAEISNASALSTYAVLYLGIFPTIIPYFALAYIISKVGASEATSSLYLTPVIAIFISWIWLGELPTLLSLLGGILTLIGVSLSNIKIRKNLDVNINDKDKQNYVDS
ncbi:DMT family transporter [Heyndrickxia ginsengihumi]|uniref:DMT family transporter n=1 Tax=Heyndrickxia ginsengihumi TaxID=363870 RepID=UPI003D25DCE2